MSFLQELAVPEWATLVPLALALGVAMYLTLLGLAVVPHLPAVPSLPGELELLATASVILPAILLYLTGWIVRRHRIAELVWEVGNVGVRVIAAGLLSLLVVPDAGAVGKVAAAIGSGIVAGSLQLLRLGWITLDHQDTILPARGWIQKLGADTVALGLLWLTLLSPAPATLLAAVVVLGLVAGGGPPYRAGRLSIAALMGLTRAAAGRSGWRTRGALPRRVTRGVAGGELGGGSQIRAIPAALVRRPASRTFHDGWLVMNTDGPHFLAQSRSGPPAVPLWGLQVEAARAGPLLTEVDLRDSEGELLLMVPVGGPGLEELTGILRAFENL